MVRAGQSVSEKAESRSEASAIVWPGGGNVAHSAPLTGTLTRVGECARELDAKQRMHEHAF
jgi:hypothetical protein